MRINSIRSIETLCEILEEIEYKIILRDNPMAREEIIKFIESFINRYNPKQRAKK